MSSPNNPLSDFATYQLRHTLIAFANTDAAASFNLPKSKLGQCGSKFLTASGEGVVIVNEIEDASYILKDLRWSFDFYSPVTPNSTVAAGSFNIADGVGNQFPSFMRRVSKNLGVAQSRMTFHLTTIISGTKYGQINPETIVLKPLIFQILDSSTGYRKSLTNVFTFEFVLLYNSLAQLPQFNRLSQCTVTNSENSPSRSSPAESQSLGITSRAEEDRLRSATRANRLSQSKPMRSLKELFSGLELELKDSRFVHNAQLQAFLSILRPSSVGKIKPPKQKRAKDGAGLPIDYSIKIDPALENYPVNNRNLLTEQVESSQSSTGIESMTLPSGSTLYSAVDEMMKTSLRTGEDVKNGFGYKTAIASKYDNEGVLRNTVVVGKYRIPRNKQGGDDTAINDEFKLNPLSLSYLDGEAEVSSVTFAFAPDSTFVVMEDDADDLKKDQLFSASQREQITLERGPDLDFMKSGFSGSRVLSNPVNFGLESGVNGLYVDSLRYRYTITQSSLTIVEMLGNPDLYSDLARNPVDVANRTVGSAKLYKFPEVAPMYINLRIRIGNSQAAGHTNHPEDEDFWYHTANYHLTGVTNVISGGRFTQILRLLSTDDSV